MLRAVSRLLKQLFLISLVFNTTILKRLPIIPSIPRPSSISVCNNSTVCEGLHLPVPIIPKYLMKASWSS